MRPYVVPGIKLWPYSLYYLYDQKIFGLVLFYFITLFKQRAYKIVHG